jgi:hypothetical protein
VVQPQIKEAAVPVVKAAPSAPPRQTVAEPAVSETSAAKPATAGRAGGETQFPAILSVPFFVPMSPTASAQSGSLQAEEDAPPRMLKVILRSTNERERDVRRLKRIHGTLQSFPGNDKYSFLVFEEGKRFLMEFPNNTTGICPELIRRIIELVGEGNISIEPIKIQ